MSSHLPSRAHSCSSRGRTPAAEAIALGADAVDAPMDDAEDTCVATADDWLAEWRPAAARVSIMGEATGAAGTATARVAGCLMADGGVLGVDEEVPDMAPGRNSPWGGGCGATGLLLASCCPWRAPMWTSMGNKSVSDASFPPSSARTATGQGFPTWPSRSMSAWTASANRLGPGGGWECVYRATRGHAVVCVRSAEPAIEALTHAPLGMLDEVPHDQHASGLATAVPSTRARLPSPAASRAALEVAPLCCRRMPCLLILPSGAGGIALG